MRFLMLVCVEPGAGDTNSTEGLPVEQWVDTYDGNGVRLLGDRIRPDGEAVAVRVRHDRTTVTDGPFVETKEVVAGFDVLECRDRDHAIEVAAAHPMARHGVIELRAFWGDDE